MAEIAPGTTFNATFTEADATDAMRLHLRPGRKLLIGIIVYLIVATLLVVAELTVGTPTGQTLALVLLFLLAFVLVAALFLLPWRARRNFREYKALQEPVTMEVRDTGLF